MSDRELDSSEWIIDSNLNTALAIKFKECLFREKSSYQTVEIFQSFDRGKILTIDRLLMYTEKDEASYHEMLVHVPMFANTGIKNVLIIGGGDGGTARELLRHESIDRITMVEIDEVVVKACKEFFPLNTATFNNKKLNIIIDNGIDFVAKAKDNTYDLVIIDSSDPVGPSLGLFTKSFYQDVARCLSPNGIATIQSESPDFNSETFIELNQCLKDVFGEDKVNPYLVFIPMYPSGMWSLTYCSRKTSDPKNNFDRDRAKNFVQKHRLKYYNQNIHQSAFTLPNYIQELISI